MKMQFQDYGLHFLLSLENVDNISVMLSSLLRKIKTVPILQTQQTLALLQSKPLGCQMFWKLLGTS